MNNTYLIGYQNEAIKYISDININDIINNDNNMIELIEVIKTEEIIDVDKTVKKYMLKYGIDNVRGGSYNKLELEEWMIKSLEYELKLLKPAKVVSQLDNYINNVTNIDEELQAIINIRQQLLKIKNKIINTDIDVDIDKTIEYQKALQRSQELQQERSKYYGIRNRNNQIEIQNKMDKIEAEINKLSQFISNNNNQKYNNVHIINQYYSNYIKYQFEYNYILETDTSIQYYSLMIFNIEQKKKLKSFCEKHGTEDELLEKYKLLLKKKMDNIKID
jgi:hypothetical protein